MCVQVMHGHVFLFLLAEDPGVECLERLVDACLTSGRN